MPVEAQATRRAPTMRAWVKAAVMPLSLKEPEGVHAFVLEIELSGPHAELAAEAGGVLQEGLAFADGADHGVGGEGEEVAEAPDAGVIEREAAMLPALFEIAQRFGDGGFGPVILDIEQVAALGAGGEGLHDIIRGAAVDVGALLESDCLHGCDWSGGGEI